MACYLQRPHDWILSLQDCNGWKPYPCKDLSDGIEQFFICDSTLWVHVTGATRLTGWHWSMVFCFCFLNTKNVPKRVTIKFSTFWHCSIAICCFTHRLYILLFSEYEGLYEEINDRILLLMECRVCCWSKSLFCWITLKSLVLST